MERLAAMHLHFSRKSSVIASVEKSASVVHAGQVVLEQPDKQQHVHSLYMFIRQDHRLRSEAAECSGRRT